MPMALRPWYKSVMDLNDRYNYYDILEINAHCPQHEITTAYERAKYTYSGENPAIYTMFNEVEARDLLKLVEEAYSVLGNKTLRALYDEKIGQKRPLTDLSFEALQTESKTVFNSTPKKPASAKSEFVIDKKIETEFKETLQWDGSMLKKAREYRKLTPDSLSEITKISSFYLRALEDMDPKNLPASVYVRGYISQVAKVLGLDEKKVCDSYMKIFKSTLENK